MRWISGLFCVVFLAVAGDAGACSVNAPAFSLGNYDPFAPSPADSFGQIAISCPSGAAYKVNMDAGRNSGGSFQPRKMIGPAGRTINYNLYTDTARAQVWGDGTGGTSVRTGTASGNWDGLPFFSRVPARQNVPAGLYDDQVVVTVEW